MTTLEKLEEIAMMTLDLWADARTMVPEHGNGFKQVYRQLQVGSWNCGLTDIVLYIVSVPASLPNREDDRWLELAAYCLPKEYKVSRLLKSGSKHEIMEYLKCRELQERILAALPQMAEGLDDL